MGKPDLINTACDELLTYGLWDVRTKVKRRIKKYVLRKPVNAEDFIFWPTGLLAVGLWNCRQEADPSLRQKIELSLLSYFTRWEKKKTPVSNIDDLIAGEVFLAVYEEYCRNKAENNTINRENEECFRKSADKLAEYVLDYPRDEVGSLPYRADHQDGHIYADGIGMICPFLYKYGSVFDRDECIELAVKQIVNFLAYGMDGSTGLPYHGYAMQTACKYGIIGWGRAVGWLLRGMIGCMITEYGLERLKDSFIRLMDTVIVYQRKDGYFSWQLQAVDGPVDTSATAMICVAIKQGIKLGILEDSKYDKTLRDGRNAIERSTRNGRVYNCSGECEGFGQYPQRYGAYPWALGPTLML